jgi:hypothetical protein
MVSLDKEQKLSQLFQLKKRLECPSQKFWGEFDGQLQEKLKGQLKRQTGEAELLNRWQKILLRSRWYHAFGKYKFYIQALAYGLGCVAFLGIVHLSIHDI